MDKYTNRSKGFGFVKCQMMQPAKKPLQNWMAEWLKAVRSK
jgi:hypothetical protein